MPQIMPRMIVAGNAWGDNYPPASAAAVRLRRLSALNSRIVACCDTLHEPAAIVDDAVHRRQNFWPARERHWLHGAIALGNQAGIMMLLPPAWPQPR
jgi:hypothetical protein